MTREEESLFLAPFYDEAAKAGIFILNGIKQDFEKHLGRKVCLGTGLYAFTSSLLENACPFKPSAKSDEEAQDEWQKIPSNNCRNQSAVAETRAD